MALSVIQNSRDIFHPRVLSFYLQIMAESWTGWKSHAAMVDLNTTSSLERAILTLLMCSLGSCTVWGGQHRSHFLQEALGCLTVRILAVTEAHCPVKKDAPGCVRRALAHWAAEK